MARKNPLTTAPPYAVDEALRRVGANLRTARLNRRLTIQEVAEKIGTGPRAVMEAEKGKPGTGAAVYAALLWTYNLLAQWNDLADPARDQEGLALSTARGRARARRPGRLDNEF